MTKTHTIHPASDGLPAHVVIHPAPEPVRQLLVTLEDGRQIAIMGADLATARVMVRPSPGGCWGPSLPETRYAGLNRGSVHRGEW